MAARMSIAVIRDIPGGFLAGTGASVMAVYEEDKLNGDRNQSVRSQTEGGGDDSGGGGGALEDEDSVGVDGVVIAKVGGYAATRFVPLCEGCGGAVSSLALAPGKGWIDTTFHHTILCTFGSKHQLATAIKLWSM
jgi:hypothetical protein